MTLPHNSQSQYILLSVNQVFYNTDKNSKVVWRFPNTPSYFPYQPIYSSYSAILWVTSLTPALRSSSTETVHFPPLSGLYPLLVFEASFLYHLVRQTRTKDVHIRIYNLKPTCWLHYDTAPLKTEAEKKIRW